MGEVQFHRGDIGQANEYIQKALKLSPNDARAWIALSRVAWVVSQRKKAVACIDKAHSLAPNDPAVLLPWAATRSKNAEAIAGYEQFLEALKKQSPPEQGNKQATAEQDKKPPTPAPQWVNERIKGLKALGDTETNALISPVAHYELPMDYILRDSQHMQGWETRVAIGTCKAVKLVIDTGAQGILIGDSLAQKCGIKKLYDGFVIGIGSKPPLGIYTGLADHVQIGPIEYKNVLIDVEDRTPVGDEAGLISTNLLGQFLIHLNLSEYKLTLDPLPAIPGDDGKTGPKDRYVAPEMASYAKVFVVDDHLLISTRVGSDPKSALFLIDTGASNNLISQRYAEKLEKLTKEDWITVRGLQPNLSKVFSADDLTLQFAGFRQMNQRLITQPLPTMGDIQMSGLLGLPILRWFTLHIDYRDGLVGFEYHEPKGAITDRQR
jgi:predicted aspartyl protease